MPSNWLSHFLGASLHRCSIALLALAISTLGTSTLACHTTKRQAEVEGVLIAQADALSKAPDGKTLAIVKGTTLDSMPEEDNVRLAIARDVKWSVVRQMRRDILSAGKTPYLLVASAHRVGSLDLEETLEGEAINIFVSVEGKLCVSPPNTLEAKCVQRSDKRHVDRSFTRELVREAVKAYHLHDVLVDVPPDLEWADLVRAVDGARTCCFDDKVRVRLK